MKTIDHYLFLARDSSDPVELDDLAGHKHWLVRARVVENKNTPLVTLVELLNDPSEGVRGRAKKNLEERSILDELLD